jgi:hypothetical protein
MDALTSGGGTSDGQPAGRLFALMDPKELQQHRQRRAWLGRRHRRQACLRPIFGASGSDSGALGCGGAIRHDILNANSGQCSNDAGLRKCQRLCIGRIGIC